MYPDISLPQWAVPRSAEDLRSRQSQDYNSLGGLGTWAAYEGFKQVVETMKGRSQQRNVPQNPATAKINLPGMVPPENLAKPWGKDGGPPELLA